MVSVFAQPLPRPTGKGDRLRGHARTSEQDLANMRADEVAGQLAPVMPKPGIFADQATAGLQRPVAGAAAALDFWNHPGTSMGERFHGGEQAYSDALNKQVEEAGPASSMLQSLAGGLVMGGPSGSLLKQGGFDAATGGVQSLSSGDSYSDAANAAGFNALAGGLLNGAGAGKGALDARDRMIQEILSIVQKGGL